MSHVVTVAVRFKNLEALEAALAEHFPKATLIRDRKNYKWFGRWMNDYHANAAAYHQGFSPDQYGKCEHVIKIEGVDYEVGLAIPKGETVENGYSPIWDFWGSGREISRYFGENLGSLVQHYSEAVVAETMHNLGAFGLEREVDEQGVVHISFQTPE